MKLKILFILVITLAIFSCKSSKFVTSKDEYKKLNLDFTFNKISIIDEREYVSSGEDIKLPILSHPNQLHNFHPKFKEVYKDIVRRTIVENLNNASPTFSTITVYVLEARKEFSANFYAEQQLVSIKLKIVIDIKGEKTEIIESGRFYRKSMDATYKSFEELFQNSLTEVTYNLLKQMKR